ncbi:vWA domain-containing protein [Pyxidicoccus xibeiensis]|uniref:vWA domain-containing protein n=1 Tax=Pyxidicoccus xibeiensis TaxID=2906759 RepID=UPI0020A813C6|nr:vWA domain-containing protein [Pyxidicoccus xibeiensis]MCP3139251.1 VWA domain-containing protein [Pyxidicoccus xibeiensis]
MSIELVSPPSALYRPGDGTTEIAVQFLVREADVSQAASEAIPLEPNEYIIDLALDNKPVDNEFIPDQSSEKLASSLHIGLVLDASFSMLQHGNFKDNDAFTPMKSAATKLIENGVSLWRNRPGSFSFQASWFNNAVYIQEGAWRPNDINSIAKPEQGNFTRLLGAVGVMADRLKQARDTGVASDIRDRHMMIVFSDGADNYSYFDNSSIDQHGETSSGADFRKIGTTPVTMENVLQKLGNHPSLSVHVLGFGEAINSAELKQLAATGGGRFFANPSAADLDSLFERVSKEFATVQTRGAVIPLPPGDYTFTLKVTSPTASEPRLCNLRLVGGREAVDQIASQCSP